MSKNSIKIGSMNGSNAIGGNVTGSVTAGNAVPLDRASLTAFLASLQESLDDLNLSNDRKSEITADIETVKAQAQSSKPKVPIIKESLSSIRSVLEGITGSIIATHLLQMLTTVL